ncbi:MAG: hypothetical protein ACLSCV_09615 [Acutalibacteraceae bacterium]
MDAAEIEYTVNPRIVRGLITTHALFLNLFQRFRCAGTVCGGGRYDGLVKQWAVRKHPHWALLWVWNVCC